MSKKRKNFSKKIKQFFTGRDIFGQPVNLNFNEEGNVYKSLFGAIITYLMFVLLFYLVAYKKGKDMFEKNNPQIGQYEDFISTQEIGQVDLKSEKFLFYFSLYQSIGAVPFNTENMD